MQLLVVAWTGQEQLRSSWQAQQSREGILSCGVCQPCLLLPTATPWGQESPFDHHIQVFPGQNTSRDSFGAGTSSRNFQLKPSCVRRLVGFLPGFTPWADRGWQTPPPPIYLFFFFSWKIPIYLLCLPSAAPFDAAPCTVLLLGSRHPSHGDDPYPRSK